MDYKRTGPSGTDDQYPQYYGNFPEGAPNTNQFNPYMHSSYSYDPGFRDDFGSANVPMKQHIPQQVPPQQMQPQFQNPQSVRPGHGNNLTPDFLGNPLADVAMQYGTKLMGTGKEMVDKEINRFVTVAKLRYFFSVDSQYVLTKLKMLLFPFSNRDWSLKYHEKTRLEPRYDHNAPDLYIPFMGYITYVLIAGLVLGTKDLFSPEVLGIIASQALAWTAVEIVIQLITIYLINTPTTLTFLDLLAYSGYKFVGIIICIMLRLLLSNHGYIISLLYCGATTAFFMVQSLKWRLMSEMEDAWSDQPHNTSYVNRAYKRKMYFLLIVGLSHIVQIWWLSSCIDVNKL